ncbi:MAG: protein kinase [Myxococcaceae bacterium]
MWGEETTDLVQVVFGKRWRLDGRLGAGGMGAVLAATDVQSGERVAIKTLAMQLIEQPEFVRRFKREAELLSRLSHPGLPPFVAIADHDGMPFFVMKLIDGRTLGDILKEKKRLVATEALPLLRQLAEVMEYLHSRGVVHRDLKPDNLMIDAAGHLTLVDFGISSETGVTRLTLPGVAVGTPMYMAPERVTSGEATVESDVYAMGMLAFTLLVGEHPFAKEDRAGMLTRQVNEVPRAASTMNPAISEAVSTVLARALNKTPSARYRSARAFVGALTEAFGFDRTHDGEEKTDEEALGRPLPPTVVGRKPTNQAVPQAPPDARPTMAASPDELPRPPRKATQGAVPAPAPVLSPRDTAPDAPQVPSASSLPEIAPTVIHEPPTTPAPADVPAGFRQPDWVGWAVGVGAVLLVLALAVIVFR